METVQDGPSNDFDVVVTGDGSKSLSFIDGLCSSLSRTGLRVSRKARHKSRISVYVFSAEFASDVWLLQDLATILDSADSLVLPIFYNVDPSEIRDQTGSSAAVFAMHDKQHTAEKITSWRIALGKASGLTGFLFSTENDIREPTRIQQIVDFIEEGLKKDNISLWFDSECCLMNSELSILPENMAFPSMTKLFLQDNDDLAEIPLSFFELMPNLMVLDMSRTSIKHLPASISHLVRLKKLLLRDCKLLMELPPEIGALQDLEVFDLEETELLYIPDEIKMLSKLEQLVVSLSNCADKYVKKDAKVIPTLSKLSNLRELSIYVDPSCEWWYEEIYSIIQDLISLEKLQKVKFYFPTVDVLDLFFQLITVRDRSLMNFRLIVGRHDRGIISRVPRDLQDSFEALDMCLKFVNGKGSMDVVGTALKYSTAFFLERHWTIDQLSRFKFSQLGKLRFCMFVECNEMRTIIGGDNGQTPVLHLLEYLCIYYMKNLESISVGPLASESFHNLQMLDLHTCPELITIFSAEMLINLVNLEELIVEDCPKVVSIVTIQSTTQFLPKLKKITLLHLPGLVSIFSGSDVAPRLECIVIFHCPELPSNSMVELVTANLKEIKGESVWWEALMWKSNKTPDHLSRAFVPFSKDSLITELAEARNSRNSLNTIHSSNGNQVKQVIMDQNDFDLRIPEKINPFPLRYYFINNREKLPHPHDGRFNPDTISWRRGETLGMGYFGPVYEGISEDGFFFAVKEVFIRDWEEKRIDQLKRDISVLSQLKHENIVQYFGTKTEGNNLYIFLELAQKGSMATLYQKFNLPHSQVSAYTRQILSGLSYLHSQNVVHMNIACANILIGLDGSVKLANFGVANVITKISSLLRRYVYPSDDIWSLGWTVLEMLTRQAPNYPLERLQHVLEMNRSLYGNSDSLSDDGHDFVLECFQQNPDKRPSAVQLLNHAFIKRRESTIIVPL